MVFQSRGWPLLPRQIFACFGVAFTSYLNSGSTLLYKDKAMRSLTSDDRRKLEELAPIRTQGLMGIVVVLITLGMMTYHARPTDATVHQNISANFLVALGNANADLQTLFNTTSFEHDRAVLRRLTT